MENYLEQYEKILNRNQIPENSTSMIPIFNLCKELNELFFKIHSDGYNEGFDQCKANSDKVSSKNK
jgi:hypothetical protein